LENDQKFKILGIKHADVLEERERVFRQREIQLGAYLIYMYMYV
jgi:hypothetical protein